MLQVNLIETNGYDNLRVRVLMQSLEIIEKVINSKEFKDKVLNYSFHFRKGIFGKTKDTFYTNQQVYSMIMDANEMVGNINSGSMDLYLNLIEGSNGNVVGYGNQKEKEIYTYKDMFDARTTKQIANHIVHEWTHKLGFTHAEITTHFGKRDNSVPYAIGYIVEELS